MILLAYAEHRFSLLFQFLGLLLSSPPTLLFQSLIVLLGFLNFFLLLLKLNPKPLHSAGLVSTQVLNLPISLRFIHCNHLHGRQAGLHWNRRALFVRPGLNLRHVSFFSIRKASRF